MTDIAPLDKIRKALGEVEKFHGDLPGTEESMYAFGYLLEALAELDKYTERLESPELLERLDLQFYSMHCTQHGNARDFEESFCKELAQAAINIIKE